MGGDIPLNEQQSADLVRSLQHTVREADQVTQALRREIEELRARERMSIPAQGPTIGNPRSDDMGQVRGSMDPTYQDTVRYEKARLPNVEVFNDGTHEEYLQWQMKMRAKLYGDRRAYPDEDSRVNYIITRTSGKAFMAIKSYVSIMISGTIAVSTLVVWGLLDGFFLDPTAKQKALEWLRTAKQGKHDLNYFVQLFNIKLAEAGLEGAHDSQKIDYLKNALSLKLLRYQAGYQSVDESYESFVGRARVTWENLQLVDRISSGRPGPIGHTATQRYAATTPKNAQPAGEPMDWTPTIAGAIQPRTKRENWGTPKEVQERRAAGSCLRCGKKGHMVRQCRADLQKHQESTVRVAAATAESSRIEELSSSDEEEGKE
jgi:hypothetical protein